MLEFLSSSVGFLASYLKFAIIMDQNIPVVATQMRYRIPSTFLYMQWVSLGGNLLQPTSTWAINSGARTTQSTPTGPNWLTAVPGLPTLYALEDREVILNPPPDAGTAASFPTMTWRYVAGATTWTEQTEIGIGNQGLPFVSDVDEDLIIWDAAVAWVSCHPSDENDRRRVAFKDEIARRLPEAKRRWEALIRDYLPTHRPDCSGRMYAAR